MKSLGISGFCQRPILQQEFGGASRMEIAKMTKIQILGRSKRGGCQGWRYQQRGLT